MWILIQSLCLVLNISEYNLLDARNVFTCFLPGGSIQTQLKNKNWEGNCLFLLCGHTVLVLRSPHYGCSSIICSKLCMGQMGTRIINRWKRTSFKKLCLDLESYATSAGEERVGGHHNLQIWPLQQCYWAIFSWKGFATLGGFTNRVAWVQALVEREQWITTADLPQLEFTGCSLIEVAWLSHGRSRSKVMTLLRVESSINHSHGIKWTPKKVS